MTLRISRQALIAVGIALVITLVTLVAGEGTTDQPLHYIVSAVLLGVHVLLCLLLMTAATAKRGSFADFFAPGSVLSLFHVGYILVPAYYLWLSLHYESNWFAVSRRAREPLFNMTVFVADVGLAGLLLGYRIGLVHRSARQLRARSSWLMNRITSPAGIVSLLAIGGITTYVVAAQLGFDLVTILLGLSVSLRDKTPPLPGYIDAGASLLMWGALLAFWRQIDRNQKPLISLALCAGVFVAHYFVFTGKRSYVAPLVVLPAIWSHYRTRWWTGARVMTYMVAMGSLMAFLLMFRILVPLYLSSQSSHSIAFVDMSSRPLGSYLDSPDLAMFDVMEASVSAPGKVISVGGGWWSTLWRNVISPVLYVVPRALWPGKPEFKDLSQIVYISFFGTEEDVGFASGFYGVLYIFSGSAGVLLGSGVLGYVAGRIYNALAPWKGDPGSIFAYGVTVWVLFTFLRFGTIGFTVVNAAQRLGVGVVLTLALVIRLRWRRPRLDAGVHRAAAPVV